MSCGVAIKIFMCYSLQCKPEQVQAIQDSQEDISKPRRDQLQFRIGDVLTVLDKKWVFYCETSNRKTESCFVLFSASMEVDGHASVHYFSRPIPEVANSWKGVLNNGKTGLFNPAHTVSYLGNILPSVKPQFSRGGTFTFD